LRFDDEKLNHSHVPAPLAPEVISQAVDLPPRPPVVLEASIDVEGIPSIGTKSVESKLPKWLKLTQKK
jgi:tether containing UBX domain for GLUT4